MNSGFLFVIFAPFKFQNKTKHNFMKQIFLFLVIFLVVSCKKSIENNEIPTEVLSKKDNKYNAIINEIPLRNFVFADSTNFDNYSFSEKSISDFVQHINFENGTTEAKNFDVRYKIPFSEKFNSIVITYQKGEFELFTTVVTLNEKLEIIDQLDIAYDEIAESAFRKISTVQKDKIILEDINYMGEEPVIETFTYVVDELGKFKQQ